METLTIEEAKADLRAVAERALRGEEIFIRVEGTGQLLSLQAAPRELPQNYLDSCYGPEELAEEDYFAQYAPRSPAT